MGIMSNLVGMYCVVPNGKGSIKATGQVIGKAEEYYIIQWIVPLTGETMTAQLIKASQMTDWVICPSAEDLNILMDDFYKNCDRGSNEPLRFKNMALD